MQLPSDDLAKQWATWAEYLGDDVVETLTNNPNLLLGEPSGPPGVTKVSHVHVVAYGSDNRSFRERNVT